MESFLVALQAISREENAGTVVPLLLVEVSQILFAGARLGAQQRLRAVGWSTSPTSAPTPTSTPCGSGSPGCSTASTPTPTTSTPTTPRSSQAQLSDDLTSIATDLANGLRHFRAGNVAEALWWWQYSYVADWGNIASAALRALQSVVAHDRLDTDFESESEQIAAAEAVLDSGEPVA